MPDALLEAAIASGFTEYADLLRLRAATARRLTKKNGGPAKVRNLARHPTRPPGVPQKPREAAAAQADEDVENGREPKRHWFEYPIEPGPCSDCPMATRCAHHLLACAAFSHFVNRGGNKLPPRTFREPTRKIFDRIFTRHEYRDRGRATGAAS